MSKIYNQSTYNRARFQQQGFLEVVNGDRIPPEEFISIMCLSNATGIYADNAEGDSLSDFTLEAGMVLYGKFTNIQVGTGRLIAYFA